MDGLLVVDKPPGPTSHDIVARARQIFGESRVGHTGTLDPAASGVLPLLFGRATRLAQFLSASDKTYDATIRLGVATDTYDAVGRPVGTPHPGPFPAVNVIEDALNAFRGAFMQRPPAYSAKRIAGRRSYKAAREHARAGGAAASPAVAPAPVAVTAHAIELVGVDADLVRLHVHCSSGFYIRSLAHDLGERLGVGAHLASLRRTRSGEATIDDAVAMAVVESDPEAARRRLVPMSGMLPALAAVVLTDAGVRRAAHGRDLGPDDMASAAVDAPPAARETAGTIRLLDGRGDLVAIAAPTGTPGILHPRVVLM